MAIITTVDIIRNLTLRDTIFSDFLIQSLSEQISKYGFVFSNDIDIYSVLHLLIKLLSINPFERFVDFDPKNKSNIMKNLITLIMQLTKELVKTRSETLTNICLDIIKTKSSEKEHIKPFVEYVLNYKDDLSLISSIDSVSLRLPENKEVQMT